MCTKYARFVLSLESMLSTLYATLKVQNAISFNIQVLTSTCTNTARNMNSSRKRYFLRTRAYVEYPFPKISEMFGCSIPYCIGDIQWKALDVIALHSISMCSSPTSSDHSADMNKQHYSMCIETTFMKSF